MADLLAEQLIDAVFVVLNDTNNRHWSRDTVLNLLNEGQSDIAFKDHRSVASRTSLSMSSGIKQTLDPRTICIMNVHKNMGTDGSTPGRVITKTTEEALNAFDPNWPEADEVAEVIHWMEASDCLSNFLVYPPSDGTGRVDMTWCKAPVIIEDESTVIGVRDGWVEALKHYILWHCFSVDVGNPEFSRLAELHMKAYYMSVNLPAPR